MGVTPAQLIANNGKLIAIIDFTGQVYEGILHYEPQDHFSIQIWTNSCCFMTVIAPEDVVKLVADPIPPIPPCLITVPCCPGKCLPGAMLMTIANTGKFCSCLINETYVLEWNIPKQKYELDYPSICGCNELHSELSCSSGKWVFYIALKNETGLTCVDGINLNFPINCATMTGEAQIEFTQTGTCSCGVCANETITVNFKPLE